VNHAGHPNDMALRQLNRGSGGGDGDGAAVPVPAGASTTAAATATGAAATTTAASATTARPQQHGTIIGDSAGALATRTRQGRSTNLR
jgi:hypothetical protein